MLSAMTSGAKKKCIWAGALTLVVALGAMLPSSDWDKAFETLNHLSLNRKVVVPPPPIVLLVSARESDAFVVRYTVEPRGYALAMVNTAEAARKLLERDRERIAVVLVDGTLRAAVSLMKASQALSPHARVIQLHGGRQPAQLSAFLMNTVLN
jgi:hypothetical protein